MTMKKYRNMKVHEQSGCRYKATPAIMLKGQWLKECEFDIGIPIIVKCESGKLTITRADEMIADYEYFAESTLENKAAEGTAN